MKPSLRPIKIDLRRDLPKALAMREELSAKTGGCLYSTPCVIGAIMSPEDRKSLRDVNDKPIGTLIKVGRVTVPGEQENDIGELQYAFDHRPSEFLAILDRLAAKYLPSEEQSS